MSSLPLPWVKHTSMRTVLVAYCITVFACVITILYVSPMLSSSRLFHSSVKFAALHTPDLSTLRQQHRQRQSTVQRFCATSPNYTVPDSLRRYFSFSDHHRLVYCSIQKVGTSFWLRVMKLLNGRLSAGQFFNGSFRHSVGIRGYYSLIGKTPADTDQLLRSYNKFLFVRDPYSRLFSAFMDKIFLPNPRTGRIARAAHRATNGKMPKALSPYCYLNVTFEDFLKAITVGNETDPHWYPMHEHCSPCTVGFQYVGKMETFMDDTEFILNEAGASLNTLTPNVNSFESDNDLTSIKDLATVLFKRNKSRNCGSDSYICQMIQKVWIVLQVRGLLSKHLPYPFPTENCGALDSADLLRRLVDLYRLQPGSRAKRMSQRKEAMMEAYYALPRWLLKRVEEYVHVDCVMFGYECSVDARFPLDRAGLFQKIYF